MSVFVRFWGVRGSIPTPGPRTRRYGGNTSCVELRTKDTLVVCDAGTGIRELGVNLLRRGLPRGFTIHLFLSHPHWDHIQGFPFFGPAYHPETTIYVYCPEKDEQNYRLLSGQMSNAYFPVKFSDLGAKILPRAFNGNSVMAGDFKVSLFEQKHPGGSLGFRFETESKTSVVYATDCEIDALLPSQPDIEDLDAPRRVPDSLVVPIRNADLLIADAQYTDSEYQTKMGWGHPRATTVVDLAIAARVKRLALTHHDPMHSDREVETKVMTCVDRADARNSKMEIFAAREGIELEVENKG
jgi:phosphoribosyl 1,2-cyclic phosphodiesterase